MSMRKSTLALAVAVAMSAGAPATVFATTGYFAHGYGAKMNGVGGAGVALPQDSMVSAVNPAGLAEVGNNKTIGLALFSPIREYEVAGFPGFFPPFPTSGPVESENEAFPIPNFGISWALDDRSALGIAAYGNGGMNTEYPDSATPFGAGVFGGGMVGDTNAGVDYMQLFINASYARKITDNASVGFSGIMNFSRFEATGLAGFGGFSLDPAHLSDNGYDSDIGFGFKLGFLADLTPSVSVGASYQSKISNTLDDYAGLFPKEGEFDIPATATIGMAFRPNDRSAVTFDVQQIWYGEEAWAQGTVQDLFQCMGGDFTRCLGGENGAGFGWEDVTVFKLGYMIETGNGWTWRVGYTTLDQPIPGGNNPMTSQTTFNILAPGVVEDHFTFGFSKDMGNGRDFSVAFMYAPEVEVTGVDAFTPTNVIDLRMYQYQLEAAFNW